MANQEIDNSKEIDLTKVSGHIKGYYTKMGDSFFNFILFLKRNIIVIAILFVLGAVLGYLSDKGSHAYEHKLLVTPNFNSTDYLYEQIDRLNKSILEQDTLYLKSLGIVKPKKLAKIEVEPVPDLFGFVNAKDNLFDKKDDAKYRLFDIMAEKGNLDKIVEDPIISRNYKYHLITFTTKGESPENFVAQPLLKFLNSSEYYTSVQQEYSKSLSQKLVENDSTIAQINRVLNNFTHSKGNAVYYNDNTNLALLVESKSLLLKEQEEGRVDLVNYSNVIKPSAVLLNIKKISITTNKMKIILPVFFIFIYLIVIRFKNFYKRKSEKNKAAVTK